MRCAYCRRSIREAQFVRLENRIYHVDCYKRHVQPRCDFCHRPIEQEYVQYEKRSYHRECFQDHVAPKCSLCGKIIEGKLLRDYWGNLYHSQHSGRETQCDYCRRFLSQTLTEGGIKHADGRRICGLCLKTVVGDEVRGKTLLQEVARRLGRHGITVSLKKCGFYLVDRDKLSRISKQPKNRADETGFTYYQSTVRSTRVNNRLSSVKIDIYILTDLPEMHFISTAAHEIMHVWQYLNAPLENDKALCEGSCNYAAFLVLDEHRDDRERNQYDRARYLIDSLFKSRNRYYGQGFRRIHRYVEKRGIPRWLSYMKKSTRLPRA